MPKRFSDEKQISRQQRILLLIGEGRSVTKQQLVLQCGVSERTIERDMATLIEKYPIVPEWDNYSL